MRHARWPVGLISGSSNGGGARTGQVGPGTTAPAPADAAVVGLGGSADGDADADVEVVADGALAAPLGEVDDVAGLEGRLDDALDRDDVEPPLPPELAALPVY